MKAALQAGAKGAPGPSREQAPMGLNGPRQAIAARIHPCGHLALFVRLACCSCFNLLKAGRREFFVSEKGRGHSAKGLSPLRGREADPEGVDWGQGVNPVNQKEARRLRLSGDELKSQRRNNMTVNEQILRKSPWQK